MNKTRCISVLVFSLLLVGSGCAAPCLTSCSGQIRHQRCQNSIDVEGEGDVEVGGQVHQPGRVKLGTGGLSLRDALMSAGGVRESARAQSMIPDPDARAALKELSDLSRSIGRIEAQERVLLYGDAATRIIPQSKEDLIAGFKELQKKQISLIKALAGQFDTVALERLAANAEEVGVNIEFLELLRNNEYVKLELAMRGDLATDDDPPAQPEEVHRMQQELRDEYQENFSNSVESEAQSMEELLRLHTTIALDLFSVALERSAVTYSIPYDMAIAGLASEIELQDGDVITVMNFRASNLLPAVEGEWGGPNTVAIGGYVENPGLTEGQGTIGQIHASTERTINDERGLWMLVRRAPDGRGQHVFLLPDHLVAPNGAAFGAPTRKGDVYTYTILPQVPIVLESLVKQTVTSQIQNRLGCENSSHKCAERCNRRPKAKPGCVSGALRRFPICP